MKQLEELEGIKMPDKGFKLEKDFTTYWLGELGKKGFWKKKWSDGSFDMKPYDCNIATPEADYYCEIKVIKKDEFSLKVLRPNQLKALEDLTNLGKNAIVVIYSIEFNNYKVYKYSDLKKLFK
ncbi:MAG: hypothetical protein PHN31_01715 [Candidatus Gracilibacteria bacterium]|nr:hypothetical protein [Candidatus Gracilibacteria bacterium]